MLNKHSIFEMPKNVIRRAIEQIECIIRKRRIRKNIHEFQTEVMRRKYGP